MEMAAIIKSNRGLPENNLCCREAVPESVESAYLIEEVILCH